MALLCNTFSQALKLRISVSLLRDVDSSVADTGLTTAVDALDPPTNDAADFGLEAVAGEFLGTSEQASSCEVSPAPFAATAWAGRELDPPSVSLAKAM